MLFLKGFQACIRSNFLLLLLVGCTGFLLLFHLISENNWLKNQHIFKAQNEQSASTRFSFHRPDYMENVPSRYVKNSRLKTGQNKTCAKYPSLKSLKFNNRYWQLLQAPQDTDFHLLSAHLDVRKLNSAETSVRIIAIINKEIVTVQTYCQLWYEEQEGPLVAKVVEYRMIWNRKWGPKPKARLAYLLTCNVPKDRVLHVPESVSLVNKPCENATNNLKVVYNRPEVKEDFAVCVKGLDFPEVDLSVKLVEWIELLLLLGAKRIFFHEFEIHPNMKKVMDYYEQRGKVQLVPFSLPGFDANLPHLRREFLKQNPWTRRYYEVVPYNDCFYKHMYEYEYIALLDTDEVIMPVMHDNWSDMFEEVLKEYGNQSGSYHFRNFYFLDALQHEHNWIEGIPRYMHMLQHVHRVKEPSKPYFYVKAFHSTERVVTLHNHVAFSCFGDCRYAAVNASIGHLHHYREDCMREKKCPEFMQNNVIDTNIWRFKERLILKVEGVIKDLRLDVTAI